MNVFYIYFSNPKADFDEKLTINIFSSLSLFLGEYQSFIYRNGVYCDSIMAPGTQLKRSSKRSSIKWYCIQKGETFFTFIEIQIVCIRRQGRKNLSNKQHMDYTCVPLRNRFRAPTPT